MKGVWLVAALLTLTTACSGNPSDDKVAAPVPSSPGNVAVKSDIEKMRDYKKCMVEQKADLPYDSKETLNLSNAAYNRANAICGKLLPDTQPYPLTPEELEHRKKKAKCMRDNGVAEFPDPDPSGADPNLQFTTDNATVNKAFDACGSVTLK